MASEPDGSIIVDTELDTQGFKAGTSRIKNAISGLIKHLKSIREVKPQFNTSTAISEIERLKAEISQLEQRIAQYEGVADLPQFNTDSFKNAIEEMKARLEEARGELSSLNSSLEESEASAASTGQKFGFLGSIASAVGRNISFTANTLTSLSSASQSVAGFFSQIHPALGAVAGVATTAAIGVAKLTGEVVKLTAKGLLKLAQVGAKAAVSGLKKLGSGIKSVISHFKNFRSSSKGTEGVISKLGKKITGLGTMLKRMVLRKILMGVIQGVKDGINNLAQYSDEFNGNLSTLKSSLTQFKNSLATAFAPILTVITPILAKLIGYLSEATTKIGQFFAALTGKSKFTKAVAVQENYADSLDKTSKSSAKATKAAKKYGDALDLDEVHDIQSISDNDKSDSGSGVSPADMFEEVPIESKIADFAKRLKDAIKKGDFAGAGALLGNGINGIVKKVNDAVSWKNVGPKVTYFVNGLTTAFNSLVSTVKWDLIGDTFAQGVNTIVNTIDLFATGIDWQNLFASIATGLNGFVSGIDWNKLGKTIGDLINIPIKAVYGFVTTFDWGTFGTSLADGFTTMVETIDWVKAAEGLSQTVIGLINALTSFIEETDWQVVGNKIADFLGAIDWGGLITALVEGIGAVLGGLASLLWGLIEDAWNSVVEWWKETAYEDGEFTIEGLLSGIVEKIKNIGTWIKEHVFQPFIDGFKKAFKINSPSKIMEEQGGFIVAGLKNGCKGLATAGLDKVNNLFISMKTGFNKFSGSANTWGKDICSNVANGINKGLSLVGNAVTKVAGKIKALLGFSEPDEGPLSDFHTYMPDMLKLMADGINKNKGVALNAVSGLADDVSKQIQNGDFTFSSIGFDNEVDTTMMDFSDTIVDSFADMLERLQAIAENVTFTVPQVVTGIVPYGTSSGGFGSGDKSDFLDELYELLKDLFMSIKPYNGDESDKPIVLQGDVNMDGQRVGTISAKGSYNEMVRSGLIRINDVKGG